jgi:hypothetical protein
MRINTTGIEYGAVGGSSESSNELADCMKDGEFSD